VEAVQSISKVDAEKEKWIASLDASIAELETKLGSLEAKLPGVPAIFRRSETSSQGEYLPTPREEAAEAELAESDEESDEDSNL